MFKLIGFQILWGLSEETLLFSNKTKLLNVNAFYVLAVYSYNGSVWTNRCMKTDLLYALFHDFCNLSTSPYFLAKKKNPRICQTDKLNTIYRTSVEFSKGCVRIYVLEVFPLPLVIDYFILYNIFFFRWPLQSLPQLKIRSDSWYGLFLAPCKRLWRNVWVVSIIPRFSSRFMSMPILQIPN